jgi:hypothetical protein
LDEFGNLSLGSVEIRFIRKQPSEVLQQDHPDNKSGKFQRVRC